MEGLVYFLVILVIFLLLSIAANIWIYINTDEIREKAKEFESNEKSGESVTGGSGRRKKGGTKHGKTKSQGGSTESLSAVHSKDTSKSTEKSGKSRSEKKKKSKKEVKQKKQLDKKKVEEKKEDNKITPFVIPGKYPKIERDDLTVTSSSFRDALSEVLPFLLKYCDDPSNFAVSADLTPGFLYNRLPTHAPAKGEPFEKIWKDFQKILLPTLTHWQHPRFLSNPSSGRSFPDAIAEMMAVGIGSPGFIWDSSPSVAEMDALMINWAGRALGLPDSFLFQGNTEVSPGGGAYMESVADSNLCAIMAARTWKTNQVLIRERVISPGEIYLFSPKTNRNMNMHHKVYSKLVFYASKEASKTLWKASRIGMVQLKTIPSSLERDHGICMHMLERRIQKDISRGLIPCCLIATLGTPGLQASDSLREMGELAKRYNMWLHVDACGIGGFWIDPKLREPQDDLWLAHSIIVDMKMFSPTMILVWTQNQAEWKMGFKVSAAYLKPSRSFALDTRDWGIHLNRRFRSLKMWISYKTIGLRTMQKHLEKQISLCGLLESLMSSHNNIRLFGRRRMATFAFQYFEPTLSSLEISKHSRRLATYINESHKMRVTSTKVAGVSVIVVTISYDGATVETITDIWKDMQALVEQYKQRKDDSSLLRFAPSPPTANSLDSVSGRQPAFSGSLTGF